MKTPNEWAGLLNSEDAISVVNAIRHEQIQYDCSIVESYKEVINYRSRYIWDINDPTGMAAQMSQKELNGASQAVANITFAIRHQRRCNTNAGMEGAANVQGSPIRRPKKSDGLTRRIIKGVIWAVVILVALKFLNRL
jgi:hypothetical protein